MSEACRIDVWLWRARFFKTRGSAAQVVAEGRVRLIRTQGEVRLDKPSRTVRCGDGLIFVVGGRLTAVTVVALGARRGPPAEAQTLYAPLDAPPPGIDT